MIGKALEFQVDQIFLDLEDAVAPEAKELARQLISSAGQKKFKAPIVSLRINSIESTWFSDDIALLKSGVGRWVDSIVLPKVRHAADVHRVSELL
ncbi:MAG: CoA ester lyase, partial [Actinobacteria bacterium]|nr:CoA ester lyase [Actinomycetota bacterium]